MDNYLIQLLDYASKGDIKAINWMTASWYPLEINDKIAYRTLAIAALKKKIA